MDRKKTTVAGAYLHLINGGATFKVVDHGVGPSVSLSTITFGNLIGSVEVITDIEGLKAMRDVLDRAIEHSYSKDYIHAAIYNRDISLDQIASE